MGVGVVAANRAPAGASFQPHVEGLRGLAALYVVMHHATLQVFGDIGTVGHVLQTVCLFGHYAVPLFIVVSGYCLMLPVTKSPDGRLRGGFRNYLWRRARRILPPYYAAVALVISVLLLIPSLQQPGGTRWDDALPALAPGVVISHLLLIHNFSLQWLAKLDGPMWSVATEWQIYFLMPLLLFIRRRWGWALVIGFGFLVGYGLSIGFLVAGVPGVMAAGPHFLGLFALGMLAAHVAVQPVVPGRSGLDALLRRLAPCLLFGVVFVAIEHKLHFLADRGIPERIVLDSVLGGATAALLLYCAQAAAMGERVLVLRVLEQPRVLALGSMSYSLYLIHDPLFAFQNRAMLALGLGQRMRFWLIVLVGIPLALGIAQLFWLLVERRFTSRPRAAEVAVALP
ncbi:MAG TPA: acyltransferase [Polyangia bacterium]|nr:acyltransferase [Polyangia bacterium]